MESLIVLATFHLVKGGVLFDSVSELAIRRSGVSVC